MNIINDGYDVNINFKESFDSEPSNEECQLILQFMPELYAEMMQLIKTDED